MSMHASLANVVAALHRGGVIAYPTEGVWGLGCDPRDEAAVLRLLALKQRDVAKGLILIASSEAQLAPFIDTASLGGSQLAEVRASWPGPNTWIMPASKDAPSWITGAHDGIAVRVTAHPLVRALCDGFGGALVSTSANIASEPSPRTRAELDPRIVAGVDAVTDGETLGRAQPSTIRDARSGAVLR
ncbi:Sua5/YciO/YrdC/YwlC family protein [Thermomonas sp. XSG]|jgi:L-threonylcarbamoyladenylate synthase|uniref:Sua5/YciO/YrdC/YwlC family protein n=1 Tax=Thermomonas sp. XSG TaxID=2771436 RepID=UPI001680A078|nr:Sua5/YciO/YrdC/YwlC family protein [Thermomonas sp. XSG]QNU14989.1 tRNA threonylcarbamoyladenosine biosynthesis protein RimN [Thermomonas sp. XSG]